MEQKGGVAAGRVDGLTVVLNSLDGLPVLWTFG